MHMAQPLAPTPFGDPAIAALPVVHPRGPFSELGLKFKEARFMKKEERPPKVFVLDTAWSSPR